MSAAGRPARAGARDAAGRLGDLGALGGAWRERQREIAREAERERARQAEAARREAAERARLDAERHAFARAVGPVHPVRDVGRLHLEAEPPAPRPHQREADERLALAATLSDEVTPESLLLTDDGLSFRRGGIGADVLARLRRGHWAIQAQLDLHGLRRDEAREALLAFVRTSRRQGRRCVRVIHGKGLGSPGREPVLKDRVRRWLAQCAEVQAFVQADPVRGGAGAVVVLLAG